MQVVKMRADIHQDGLTRLRLQVATVLLVLFGVTSFSAFLIGLITDTSFWSPGFRENLVFALAGAMAVVLYRFLNRTPYQNAVLSLVPLIPLLVSIRVGWWESLLLLTVFLTLISAALLCGPRLYGLVTLATAARLVLHFTAIAQTLPETRALGNPTAYLLSLILMFLFPFLIGLVARYTLNTLRQSADQSNRTVQLLGATAAIGQVMLRLLDLNSLLSRAVEVIRDRFGFYHTQIYLLDETRTFAILAASTGDTGQQLLSRQYRLPLSRQSLIARAIQAGEPIKTTEVNDPYRQLDIMPRTRSEMAIPISDGETTIGVLDIQSLRQDAFSPLEIQALQVMTSQLATAIRNARLFEAQEQSLRENKRLFFEAEASLREIQTLNRQMTRETWQEYLKVNRAVNGVTLDETSFRPDAAWSERMMQAGLRRRPMTTRENDKAFIAVPVELRGEVIGAVEIEIPEALHSEGIIDMMQAIAARLAISLDNARLFEETQEATAQEQRINEIVSKYQAASTVDDLLQVTLESLFETLGAEAASIRLGQFAPNVTQTGEAKVVNA